MARRSADVSGGDVHGAPARHSGEAAPKAGAAGKKGSRNGGWSLLWRLVAPHRKQVVTLSLVSLGSALLEAGFIVLLTGIAMSLVNGQATVGPLLGQSFPTSLALVAAAIALFLRVVFSLGGVRISAQLTADVTTAQRRRLSHAYLRTSWNIQHDEPSGRLQELLTSFVTQITSAVNTLTNFISAGLSLLAFLAMSLAMDPLSTAAVLVALGVVSLVLVPLRRAIRRRSGRNAVASLAFSNSVAELGALGMEMQTFGAENSFEALIDRLTLEASSTARRTTELRGAMPQIYMSLAYAAVLAGVAILSTMRVVDFAVIGAIMLLMLRSISYGQQLSTASAALAVTLPFLEGVEATVTRYAEAGADRKGRRPAVVTPVVAQEVGFEYTSDRDALSGVNFRLEHGEALGLIGPSGAGKSTLAQLLLGLREPTRGTLTAGGIPLADIDRDWWTDRVAFVPQDANLFTGTVAENIRFFRDGISDADLRQAALRANVLADIEALPEGFSTHLGERGSQLSGGQKQRLSIARALVGRPELLVLDEPTSALDGQSEALVRDTLAELRGVVTIVIIAHRMSTLDVCDRIMVIEKGCVTALDTPEALRGRSKFYRQALAVAGIATEPVANERSRGTALQETTSKGA